jgi:hypothetical protein
MMNFKTFEVRWYHKGKLDVDDEPKKPNKDYIAGDGLQLKNAQAWYGTIINNSDYGYRRGKNGFNDYVGSDEDKYYEIEEIKYAPDLGIPYDGYVYKVFSKWPWYRLKEDINEKVRWYYKGKLENDELDEEINENEFAVGDKVIAIKQYFWDDGSGNINNVGVKGYWDINHNKIIGKVIEVNTCKNAKGYSGQIIKIEIHWPWFQTTNFEKV